MYKFNKKNIQLFITIMSVFLSFSCIKEENKSSSEKNIIQSLNKNDPGEAIRLIDEELINQPNNDNLLFYKTSALSQKGGVDVYSLFPLLKMKIFEVAVSQWQQNQQTERRLNQRRNDLMGFTLNDDEQNDDVDSKIELKVSEEQMQYHITFIGVNIFKSHSENIAYLYVDYIYGKDYRKYNQVTLNLTLDEMNDLISKLKIKDDEYENNFQYRSYYTKKEDIDNFAYDISAKVRQSIVEIIKRDEVKKIDKNKENQASIKYLNFGWAFLDSIPMLKKTPIISDQQSRDLEEAQGILKTIMDKHVTDELGIKSGQQLALISALKIVNALKKGIDLDSVTTAMDLICKLNDRFVEEMVASSKDVYYFLYSQKYSETTLKNQEQYNAKMKLLENYIAETQDVDLNDRFIKKQKNSIERFKELNCVDTQNL